MSKEGEHKIDNQDVINSQEWEEYVSTGIEARSEKDKAQWLLGDLAFKVYTAYGRFTVEKYAVSIGMEKSTLLRYMDVSRAIPELLREDYKKLSWSHFRVAAGTDDPEAWLEKASDNNWSVELMGIEIKKDRGEEVPPEPKVKMVECPKCHQMTLVGDPEKICRNFRDCTQTM